MALRRIRHRYMPTMMFKKHTRDFEGAFCLTCLHPVDEEEIVEGFAGKHPFCRVLYRCHGAEELVQYDFDTVEWDDRDFIRMVTKHRFFDPMGHKDEGKLVIQVQ